MDIDWNKVDEFALAVLFITSYSENNVTRAWKGMDWEILNHLTAKGYIGDAKNKNKSVVFTEEGISKGKELVEKYFRP